MNGKCKYGSNCLYSHDITTTTTTSIITPSSHEKGELPSDVLVMLPILRGDGGEGMSGVDTGSSVGNDGGGDEFADFGDIDLNMDAEIDMALCMSMEEERVLPAAAASSEEAKTEDGRRVKMVLLPFGWMRSRKPCYNRPLQCQ